MRFHKCGKRETKRPSACMREQKRADFFFFTVIKSQKLHISRDKTVQSPSTTARAPLPRGPASPAYRKKIREQNILLRGVSLRLSVRRRSRHWRRTFAIIAFLDRALLRSISTEQARPRPNPSFSHCLILSSFLAHLQDEEEGDGEEGEENLVDEEEEKSFSQIPSPRKAKS